MKQVNNHCGCQQTEAKIPVYCQLGVFNNAEFELHKNETVFLHHEISHEMAEIEEGYKFTYIGDVTLYLRLASWVSREHQCCSWAKFKLELCPMDKKLSQNGGLIVLSITGGGEEGKQVLKQGFSNLQAGIK